MAELVVATKNKKKLQEIKEILKGLDLKVISLLDYARKPRIIENGKTFKANAIKKAVKVARFSGKLTLGEDSGLCVKALKGKPGVYSSRFAGKAKSDRKNYEKLLELMSGWPLKKRKAYYSCAVALADKKGLVGVVEGICSGFISRVPRGHFGFGYDPVFVVPGYKKTFAELGSRIKHKISHRFRALSRARRIIEKYVEHHRPS